MNRNKTIDRYRGIAIFSMIIFQFIKGIKNLGFLSRLADHSLDNGIIIFKNTVLADIVAPIFFFTLALTYGFSYKSRVEKNKEKDTILHFIYRGLILIGLGSFLGTVDTIFKYINNGVIYFIDKLFIFTFAIIIFILLMKLLVYFKVLRKYNNFIDFTLKQLFSINGILTLIVSIINVINIYNQRINYGYWLVLQPIGAAILISIPFIRLKYINRIVCGSLFFISYFIFYELIGYKVINNSTQGGILGSIGWSFIIISGSIFMDLYKKDRKYGFLMTSIIIIIGLIAYFTFPIIKQGVKPNPTFIIVSIGISLVIYIIIDLFRNINFRFDIFSWWGRYPILLYLLEFGVVGLFKELFGDYLLNVSAFMAIIYVIIIIVSFTSLVYFLNNNNKKISI